MTAPGQPMECDLCCLRGASSTVTLSAPGLAKPTLGLSQFESDPWEAHLNMSGRLAVHLKCLWSCIAAAAGTAFPIQTLVYGRQLEDVLIRSGVLTGAAAGESCAHQRSSSVW